LPGPLLLVDFETTSVDAEVYDICEFGAAVVTEDLRLNLAHHGPVRPLSRMRDPKAMMVHRISEQVLMDAPPLSSMLEVLEGMVDTCVDTEKLVLAGWGVDFDERFLKAAYKKVGRPYPFGYRKFDIKPVAIFALACRGRANQWGHLDRCMRDLDLEFQGTPHNALDDVLNTLRILRRCAGVE
jgi:DNA polymerase III epsilon subunit-like protein